ncbi:hypothetical protein GA0061098_1009179 [Bradyrhizobium shewense]|uniref:Uncharacterized protein n=1 Tax=Bradyrhizobium shewense TaxID=1761772 RepID=A0A1C3WRW9_9BRAD|nr:hypothetical protein [Bradyrhizobium shewense]SCB42787.1 hypothetical protein GA0061098_1009179 [Bradyrhizobium shewense]
MDLTDFERAFLKQLSTEPWISTPLFDHELVARLVELGLIDSIPKHQAEPNTQLPPRVAWLGPNSECDRGYLLSPT